MVANQKQVIEGYRLSPQQNHLWLLQGKSVAFRSQCAVWLEGELRLEVLEAALQQTIERHEILRTTFEQLPGMNAPLQIIGESVLSLRRIEVTESELHELRREEFSAVFDFVSVPPVRFCLAKLTESKHVLLMTLSALCADARTMHNLAHEIGRHYGALLNSQAASDEPLQYVQFSEWQNELLASEDAAEGRKYWGEADAVSQGVEAPNPGRTQPSSQIFAPQSVSRILAAETAAKIEEFAVESELSPELFFLTCWKILVWKRTRQIDFPVYRLFEHRKYTELQETLGLFAKYLPLKVDIEDET